MDGVRRILIKRLDLSIQHINNNPEIVNNVMDSKKNKKNNNFPLNLLYSETICYTLYLILKEKKKWKRKIKLSNCCQLPACHLKHTSGNCCYR